MGSTFRLLVIVVVLKWRLQRMRGVGHAHWRIRMGCRSTIFPRTVGPRLIFPRTMSPRQDIPRTMSPRLERVDG